MNNVVEGNPGRQCFYSEMKIINDDDTYYEDGSPISWAILEDWLVASHDSQIKIIEIPYLCLDGHHQVKTKVF